MKNVSRMGPEDYAWNVQSKLLFLFRCSSSRASLGLQCFVCVHSIEALSGESVRDATVQELKQDDHVVF